MSTLPDPIISNSHIYRDIAEEALAASEADMSKNRRPMADGSPGHVITWDPARVSFKQSMVAIVFAGMRMEARLWQFGCASIGVAKYKAIDRLPLEERASTLGLKDAALQTSLKAFRESRKELVHEKAVPLSIDTLPWRTAQEEAAKAVDLMRRLDKEIARRTT